MLSLLECLFLLLSLLLLLFVLAVILSAAKDPEAFHPAKPIDPFSPSSTRLPLSLEFV